VAPAAGSQVIVPPPLAETLDVSPYPRVPLTCSVWVNVVRVTVAVAGGASLVAAGAGSRPPNPTAATVPAPISSTPSPPTRRALLICHRRC
jgi:hypothetical protein